MSWRCGDDSSIGRGAGSTSIFSMIDSTKSATDGRMGRPHRPLLRQEDCIGRWLLTCGIGWFLARGCQGPGELDDRDPKAGKDMGSGSPYGRLGSTATSVGAYEFRSREIFTLSCWNLMRLALPSALPASRHTPWRLTRP
jgi:hypothetical protein